MKFKTTVNIYLVFILCIMGGMSLQAAVPIVYTDALEGDYIGKYISVLQDPSKKLGIQDVLSGKMIFQPCEQDVPNLGIKDANNWLRFELQNETDRSHLVLELSSLIIDEVKLYILQDGRLDSIALKSETEKLPRNYPHQFYVFDLHIPPGESVVCYLKLKSYSQLLVPLAIYKPNGVFKHMLNSDKASALYLGLMLSIVLYNLFLFFSTGERHYIVYVNYVFWVTAAQMSILGVFETGLGLRNIWTPSLLVTFFGAVSGIGTILFVKTFLKTASNTPKLNILLDFFMLCYIFAILLLFFGEIVSAYKLVNIVAGCGSAIVLILAFRMPKEQFDQTKIFIIAWSVFLVTVLIYVLKDYGVLPYNSFTVRSVQFGSFVEAILLSFALGNKINVYRREKEQSQARELAVSLENERLIKERNASLEQMVEKRTQELTVANHSLQQTLTDLQQAQSQLVEAEKMASLGQLTAGVAHEINNPINFIAANVGPLRRDVQMIWDVLDKVEDVAIDEELAIADKKNQIHEYKSDIDVEYLKTEVEFLLKGMQDGANRTTEIVKSLRIFSRVDEDSFLRTDLHEGLESTLVILKSSMKDKITVVKNYGELPLVECHAGKINQVFLNILTNAAYAIDKKFETTGGQITIETGIASDPNYVFISIRDNGIGIPEKIKKKIFDPFFTTKAVGEGTGLGMSITYNTIAKHQGRIIVDSVEGEYTIFKLFLPIIHIIAAQT